MNLQGQELWNHIETKVRQKHDLDAVWTLGMVDLRDNDSAYYRINRGDGEERVGSIFYGEVEPEEIDPNQLTMDIDNDVVIVNPVRVGD